MLGKVFVQPAQIEELSSGALWSLSREEFLAQQRS